MSTLVTSNISDGTTTVGTEYVVNGSAKSWVNFNGTGTVAIRESFNVASITDNGTGLYTLNFATVMSDSNYAVAGSASNNDDTNNESYVVGYNATSTYTESALQVTVTENTSSATVRADTSRISVAVFR